MSDRESPIRLILDTNAVLDWLHFCDPGFGAIALAIANSSVEVITGAECLEELRQVLQRPHFGLDATAQAAILAAYASQSRPCVDAQDPIAALPRCRDRDDQKFIELACRAQADFLLTKDKALLRLSGRTLKTAGFKVLKPGVFAGMLEAADG